MVPAASAGDRAHAALTRVRGSVRVRRLQPHLATLLWAFILLALGSIPNVPAPDTTLPLDKFAHLLLYGLLGLLLARGWRNAGQQPPAALLIVLGLLTGVLDELHQARVPGRSPEVADWLMDALGVTAGFATGATLRRRLRVATNAHD
jgi:VanZ family protein